MAVAVLRSSHPGIWVQFWDLNPPRGTTARWAHLGVSHLEAEALKIEAYVEMLKALAMFRMEYER